MFAEPVNQTTSGLERRSLAKEEVANHVQRLRRGPSRFVMIRPVDSSSGSTVLIETEDTFDEPWARHVATLHHPRFNSAALVNPDQSLQELQRFWESVKEHTEGPSTPDIRPSTIEQTGPHVRLQNNTPEYREPPIWEVAAQIAAQVPDADWAKVPRDLARNVDHYLHGTPKKKENE